MSDRYDTTLAALDAALEQLDQPTQHAPYEWHDDLAAARAYYFRPVAVRTMMADAIAATDAFGKALKAVGLSIAALIEQAFPPRVQPPVPAKRNVHRYGR